MKILSSLLLPIFVIILAIGGAFAMKSSNEAKLETTYYWRNDVNTGNPAADCLPSTSVEPCDGNNITCRLQVPEASNNLRDIFQDSECEDPYLMDN